MSNSFSWKGIYFRERTTALLRLSPPEVGRLAPRYAEVSSGLALLRQQVAQGPLPLRQGKRLLVVPWKQGSYTLPWSHFAVPRAAVSYTLEETPNKTNKHSVNKFWFVNDFFWQFYSSYLADFNKKTTFMHLSVALTDLFLLWVLRSTSLPCAITTQRASKGHAAALLIAGIKGRRFTEGAGGGWIRPVRPHLQGVRRGEVSQIRVHWGKREAASVWTLHPGWVRGRWRLGCRGSFWTTTVNLHAFIYCSILGLSMGGLRTLRPHRFCRFLRSRIRACISHTGRCQQRRRSLNLTKDNEMC